MLCVTVEVTMTVGAAIAFETENKQLHVYVAQNTIMTLKY